MIRVQPRGMNSNQEVASTQTNTRAPFLVRTVNLYFPRFDGTEPIQWISMAEQFFEYYDTPDNQRITIASVRMDGDVIPWFQMMNCNK